MPYNLRSRLITKFLVENDEKEESFDGEGSETEDHDSEESEIQILKMKLKNTLQTLMKNWRTSSRVRRYKPVSSFNLQHEVVPDINYGGRMTLLGAQNFRSVSQV